MFDILKHWCTKLFTIGVNYLNVYKYHHLLFYLIIDVYKIHKYGMNEELQNYKDPMYNQML